MRPTRPRRRLLACAAAALLAAGPAGPAAALPGDGAAGEAPAQPAQVDPPPLPPVLWSDSERIAGRGGGLDPGCAPVTLVAVPGTGETNAVRDPDVAHGRITPGLAADLRAGLGGRAVRAVWLPYPADAVATMGYAESRARGLAALHRLLGELAAACPGTRLALAGYSQGADILAGFAADLGRGAAAVPPERIAAVAVFGNPRRGMAGARPAGTAAPGGIGVLGPAPAGWGPLAGRVLDACNAGDLWCESTPALRAVAGGITGASLNPARAGWSGPALGGAGRAAARAAAADPSGAAGSAARLAAFLAAGQAAHTRYEEDLDGAGSARAAAAAFLLARLR
ncbi:cutinase family protein [Corynebacterium sphenisci]|uniref:cutinase family protein n=1 Tax=Corynebacterium sphenisci TaxID=191493 RepID=UPI0026DF64AF|nr:cutinase family protein [Corynebacterium sphenisci]MDO5731573.1 cutinase family protein [Corynebacterium sphenisci]